MQSIHQQDLVNYLRGAIPPSDAPKFLFIGANDGFSDDTQETGLDFVFDFLRESPWWTGVFVEPIPSVFRRLKENYRHHTNQFSFLNAAVSDRRGKQTLNICGRDGKASSLVYGEIEQEKFTGYSMKEQEKFRIASGTPEAGKIEVPTIHYEEILQITGIDNFDFIKIDAEGMDKEIVFQILNISEARNIFPGCIYFEEHSVDKPLIARLFQLNYITFPTGITKSGKFIDRCAIRRNFLRNSIFPPKFILDSHH